MLHSTSEELINIKTSVCFDNSNNIYRKREEFWSTLFKIENDKDDFIKEQMENIYYEAYRLFNTGIEKLRSEDIRVCSFKFEGKKEYQMGKIQNRILGGFLPCIYQANMTKIPATPLYKLLCDKKLSPKQNAAISKAKLKAFLTKTTKWSSEKEWRLILDSEFCRKFDYKLPFPYIDSIYLGSRMSDENVEALIRLAKRLEIKVYGARLDEDTFELSFIEINAERYLEEQERKSSNRVYDIIKEI